MTPDAAIALAAAHCVSATSLLAAARLSADASDRNLGRALAAGVVCGWADHTSVGVADTTGITVRDRGETIGVRVRWEQVATHLRPGLAQPGVTDRLANAYDRYLTAATDTTIAGRLAARAASAALAQLRRLILDGSRIGPPVQQCLFPPPPSRGRSRPA